MAEALTDMLTVGELIAKLRRYPPSAILAIDVSPTDDAVYSIEMDDDIATYADENGDVKSGPLVIFRVK